MLFRTKRFVRAIACFFLLEVVGSLALPTVTLAAIGPSQPEFTSYEAPGATDMVNLSTGDFSYSIPILDIPGPERSFSLPLTYRADIQLEQEASWVGLGWSVNAGAIARSVNGYADDADNEPVRMTFFKVVERGGSAYIFPGLWRTNWSLNNGTSGSIDLLGLVGVNWDKDGVQGGDIIGIGYQAGEGFGVDPVRLAMAAVTIATLGAGSVAAVATNIGFAYFESTAMSMAIGAIGLGRQGGVSGFNNEPITYQYSDMFETNYGALYDNDTKENAFGSLYFAHMSQTTGTTNTGPNLTVPGTNYTFKAPQFASTRTCNWPDGTILSETASDIYQSADGKNDGYYETSKRPLSIAHDYYQVMGETVSGNIRPQRLDIGSVAYPKLGRDQCDKHQKYMVVPFTNHKVGFRYEGSLSNTYDHHQYQPTGSTHAVGFDVNSSRNAVIIADSKLTDINNRIEPNRKGLVGTSTADRQLVQGKHTVWYSNAEIEQMTSAQFNGYPNGFLDFKTPTAGSGTTNAFRHQLPPKGIGAFAVTAEDGTTYHYSLPVYHYRTYNHSQEQQTTNTVGELGSASRLENDPGTDNPNPHGGYATTWLLTAITSSDYIDRDNTGTVTEGDWGGWVKFEYGRFSSQYKWRQPYIGTSYSDVVDPIQHESYTEGYREAYYLNSISTRSHTALFVKSAREDGRGHFSQSTTQNANLKINDFYPSSSLRLDEIILLDNATLKKLQEPDGSDPNSLPALTNNTNNNASSRNCDCGDDFGQVLDKQDITVDSRIQNYLEANAIKRIRFNYSYDLCRGTPNSFTYNYQDASSLPSMLEAQAATGRGGKLTLKSVSFFGPTVGNNVTKIIPDFTFGYDDSQAGTGSNPGYSKEKWDGFGMYQPSGTHSILTHKPSTSDIAPWTLRKITSPIGTITEVKYERDIYAHVSNYGTTKLRLTNANATNTVRTQSNGAYNVGALIHVNDSIPLSGTVRFSTCTSSSFNVPIPEEVTNRVLQGELVRVTGVAQVGNEWEITLDSNFQPLPNLSDLSSYPGNNCSNSQSRVGMDLETVIVQNVRGGGFRVAELRTTDAESGNSYKVRYSYTTANSDGYSQQLYNSSGVIAKEPNFINRFNHLFYRYFDYPSSPVLYSRVTVDKGPFGPDEAIQYNTREVYSFYTPSANLISETDPSWFGYPNVNGAQIEFYNNIVNVNVGIIGQPKLIQVYNGAGHEESKTEFSYASQVSNTDGIAKQGYYTEGLLSNEWLDLWAYRVNRTTKKYIPSVLAATKTTRNGISVTNTNEVYDFYTGQVLGTATTNSNNEVIRSRTIPAYTKFPGMGAKADGITNSHMLAQPAAVYTFKEKAGTSGNSWSDFLDFNKIEMLSASVQTWKGDWNNHRAFNSGNANAPYGDAADSPRPVWREAATYQWQSPLLNPNGSFARFADYSWQGTPDAHWKRSNEHVRYDHNSHSLESHDINELYTTQKLGYNQAQQIAAASNARYTELAYSGAEDVENNTPGYLGGEIAIGGVRDQSQAHSGWASNRLDGPSTGFVYRARAGTSFANGDILIGKSYRLSVWVRPGSGGALQNAKLFVSNAGTALTQPSITATETRKAGQWYRLTMNVTLPSGATNVSFGCQNTSAGTLYFDDFRLSPLDATVTSNVYNPRTHILTHTLDNENLYTYYEYNAVGSLVRIYKESFDRTGITASTPRLVKEFEYNYARMHAPSWVSQSYRCISDANGNLTGTEMRTIVDVNPLNNPPTTSQEEVNGTSEACAPVTSCAPHYYNDIGGSYLLPSRIVNNQCQWAVFGSIGGCSSCPNRPDGNGGQIPQSRRTYYWVWPGGGGNAGSTPENACADGACGGSGGGGLPGELRPSTRSNQSIPAKTLASPKPR